MMEWQTIETAPRDGTKIILLADGEPFLGYYVDLEIRKYGKSSSHSTGWRMVSLFPSEVEPTHWLALPARPVGQ